jgi:hypothetical protein
MGQAQQEQYRIAKHAYWLEQQASSDEQRLSSDAQTGTMDEYEIREYIVRLRSAGVIQDAVRVKRPRLSSQEQEQQQRSRASSSSTSNISSTSNSSNSHPKRQRLAVEEDERAVIMMMTMMTTTTTTTNRQQYPKAAEEGERGGGGGGADMLCFGAARDNSFSSESSLLPVDEVSESTVTGINSSSSSLSDLGSLLEPDGVEWTGNNSQP